MGNTTYKNEDTIDLRELWRTFKERKRLIYVVTMTITILAILYAFVLAKPVYQVQAMIEIGKIEAGTKNEAPLDNINDIKQKLEYQHGVHSKKRRKFPNLKSITAAKKSKSIFSVVVEGRDNNSAKKYIEKLVEKLEANYAKKVELYISTQKGLISLSQEDIMTSKNTLGSMQTALKNYNEKILNITQKDAALAGLYAIQIGQNQTQVQELQLRISKLKTDVFNFKLSITPLRITQTHIVGEIEVLEKPLKPKKALIVIVAFITGLMFSLFLVFFLAFIKGIKEEE